MPTKPSKKYDVTEIDIKNINLKMYGNQANVRRKKSHLSNMSHDMVVLAADADLD